MSRSLFVVMVLVSQCISLFGMHSVGEAMTGYPGVEKLTDDLYVGKVNDDFYLGMERVTDDNIAGWLAFAHDQLVVGCRKKDLKYLPSIDGSEFFEQVLHDYDDAVIAPYHELWVAYASSVPVVGLFNIEDAAFIDMFVTVITTQDALLTSHMGISRTWQAAQAIEEGTRTKHADQSIHLHSFAAKVMRLRDHRKMYMLTVPVPSMRAILIAKLPALSVFVGDSVYNARLKVLQKGHEELQCAPVAEVVRKSDSFRRKAADDFYFYDRYKEQIGLLQTNPYRIIRHQSDSVQEFTIQWPHGEPLVTFDEKTAAYQWLFTRSYVDLWLTIPYVLVDLDVLAGVKDLVA